MYRPYHTWPRLKDVVRFPIATFLQRTSKEFAFPPPSFAAHAACLALLSVMSRFWSGVLDVLPLMPPPRGEVRETQLPWPLFESSPVALHGLHYRSVGHSELGDCGLPR